MPIELNRLRGRKQVAWLREQPAAEGERVFREREFSVTACADQNLQEPEFLAGLSAVVFTQGAEKPLQIAKDLEIHAHRLLDHDCRIILRPAANGLAILINVIDRLKLPTLGLPRQEAERLRKWQNPEDGDPPPPYAAYFPRSVPWSTVANLVSESPPGRAPNHALNITIDDGVDDNGVRQKSELDGQSKLLLRRAFSDPECVDVHLVPMEDGKSGAKVYRAYAEMAGLEGLWPQPHFVKIGDRARIFAEYKIYEEKVDPYVPFHLGPHLERDRCCLGANKGIIVGDYVEESESLHACASTGRSTSAIACLFDRTLLGWHRQAVKTWSSLADGLVRRVPRKFPDGRIQRAQELGATLSPADLLALFKRCTSKPVLVGPIHGDLHAGNVRVRATDAIVIDFYAHRRDPLVYDAACLEASLLVDGFAGDDRDVRDWLQSVESLYESPVLACGEVRVNPKSRSSWFYACVQQTRRYARQWECGQDQYAGALAVALLIKASKDRNATRLGSDRRAAAYVLAERVLAETFGSKPDTETSAVAS
jgi:hypothetical protein